MNSKKLILKVLCGLCFIATIGCHPSAAQPQAEEGKKFTKYLFAYFPSNDNENVY